MKKKQLAMLALLVILAVLLAVTIWMPGTAGEGPWAYATIFSLLPPVITIGLALVTKEVYTSLLARILAGGLLYSNFNLEKMINTIFFQEEGGMVYKLADAWNMGILVFLVMLGILILAEQGRWLGGLWKMGIRHIRHGSVHRFQSCCSVC